MSSTISSRVDHLVYATRDLESTIASLEQRLGVRASPGGQHFGRGTRNALIALGPRCYLEIIGPDPEQPAPATPRWFSVDRVESPRLVAWAANATNLDRVVADGAAHGVRLGAVASGTRQRSDGVTLSWRFTDPTVVVEDGVVPFFIDWGSSPHPASTASAGVMLASLVAEHPAPDRVRKGLAELGLDLRVAYGPTPALVAAMDTSAGVVEIR